MTLLNSFSIKGKTKTTNEGGQAPSSPTVGSSFLEVTMHKKHSSLPSFRPNYGLKSFMMQVQGVNTIRNV